MVHQILVSNLKLELKMYVNCHIYEYMKAVILFFIEIKHFEKYIELLTFSTFTITTLLHITLKVSHITLLS